MDNTGHARITDFGLAKVTTNMDSIQSAATNGSFTPRWTAHEVLRDGGHSKEADIFSFAMVMVEVCQKQTVNSCEVDLGPLSFQSIQVFSGAIPFAEKTATAALFDIMNGGRPQRPIHPTFTAGLWTLMQSCWNQDPYQRPAVMEVLNVLRGV